MTDTVIAHVQVFMTDTVIAHVQVVMTDTVIAHVQVVMTDTVIAHAQEMKTYTDTVADMVILYDMLGKSMIVLKCAWHARHHSDWSLRLMTNFT